MGCVAARSPGPSRSDWHGAGASAASFLCRSTTVSHSGTNRIEHLHAAVPATTAAATSAAHWMRLCTPTRGMAAEQAAADCDRHAAISNDQPASRTASDCLVVLAPDSVVRRQEIITWCVRLARAMRVAHCRWLAAAAWRCPPVPASLAHSALQNSCCYDRGDGVADEKGNMLINFWICSRSLLLF